MDLFLLATGTNERARISAFHRRARARGMQLGPFNVIVYFSLQSGCQTNTLICTHPVHCDAYRGAPREQYRLPVNNSYVLFFSTRLLIPLLSILYRSTPCTYRLRLFLRVLFLIPFRFVKRRWWVGRYRVPAGRSRIGFGLRKTFDTIHMYRYATLESRSFDTDSPLFFLLCRRWIGNQEGTRCTVHWADTG